MAFYTSKETVLPELVGTMAKNASAEAEARSLFRALKRHGSGDGAKILGKVPDGASPAFRAGRGKEEAPEP